MAYKRRRLNLKFDKKMAKSFLAGAGVGVLADMLGFFALKYNAPTTVPTTNLNYDNLAINIASAVLAVTGKPALGAGIAVGSYISDGALMPWTGYGYRAQLASRNTFGNATQGKYGRVNAPYPTMRYMGTTYPRR